MSTWNFKASIEINGQKICADSRKFEFLVCDYLNSCFPLEDWKITPATNDGNRDAEAFSIIYEGKTMWAEAKYSIHNDRSLSSTKYDSTLVSAKLNDNVIRIFFVTNSLLGPYLVERVSSFCHLIRVNEVQFIEKNILEYWITQHPDIQKKYFTKWILRSTERAISLRTVRVFHRKDSYTLDALLECQKIIPLYNQSNYLFECEIIIIGYENTPITIFCNDEKLYDDVIQSGIFTLNLSKVIEGKLKQSTKEYALCFYYQVEHEKKMFGTYTIKLSDPLIFYAQQLRLYETIKEKLNLNIQLIYNIWGKPHVGKSWLLKRLQEDLLNVCDDNSKTIYIAFIGSQQDVGSLCRLIFTLIFDFYNLGISSDALNRYCEMSESRESIFSYDKINTLITSLKREEYLKAEDILLNCIELDETPIFEYLDCFSWRKVYIIDNIHLLSSRRRKILNNILNSFQSNKQIIFIVASRKPLDVACVSYGLTGLDSSEILELLNNRFASPIKEIAEVLPDNHQLTYPLGMNLFLNCLDENIEPHSARNRYVQIHNDIKLSFSENAVPISWTAELLVIFLVENGVDAEILLEYQSQSYWSDLLEQDIVTLNQGYFYPTCIIPQNKLLQALEKYSACCEKILLHLLKEGGSPNRYRNALLKHYPSYCNQLWKDQFQEIEKKHTANCYQDVRELCDAVLVNEKYFSGNSYEMRRVKYLQAFSYMHCTSSKEALPLLENLIKEYERYIPVDSLYYTALSEIIDAQYWEWENYEILGSSINKFRKGWKHHQSRLLLDNRAFLTATNRMMVYFLAIGSIRSAEKWLKKNLRLASQFSSSEHIGYTLMDFAKGIYHIDLKKALRYLIHAEHIFEKLESEQRRLLDCRCEIAYVKCLLYDSDVQILKDSAAMLYQHQYWVQYYKCKLKLICIYLIKGDIREAKRYYTQAHNSSIIFNSVRCQYFMSILGKIIDTNYSDEIVRMYIPNSYRTVHLHNKHCLESNWCLYQKGITSNQIYLDPRIW